jgi:hypothetical protein
MERIMSIYPLTTLKIEKNLILDAGTEYGGILI